MIRKRDNGANEVLRKYRIGTDDINAGFVGPRSEEIHQDSNLTNAELAAVHEFGLGNQTAKHFIRDSFDENLAKNRRLLKRLHHQWIRGRITKKQLNEKLGEALVRQIKRKINEIGLVETGELRNAVDWEKED